MEFIKFDDNDRGGRSGFGGAHPFGPSEDLFNTKIYYCYYEPGEESTEDLGTGKSVNAKVMHSILQITHQKIENGQNSHENRSEN